MSHDSEKMFFRVSGIQIPVIILCFLTTVKAVQETRCPPPEDIPYCTCNDSQVFDIEVFCKKAEEHFLRQANDILSNLTLEQYEVGEINLTRSANGIFETITPKRFVIYNSDIEYFSLFTDIHGMENTLISLALFHVFIRNLNLSSGSDFHKLERFELIDCAKSQWDFNSLTTSSLPNHLRYIQIRHCGVTLEHNSSFVRFRGLRELLLSNNLLDSVTRNLLPRPASNLSFYDLSVNPITVLPDDMFEDMPVLETVWLQETYLQTLQYRVFHPVFHQLKFLQIWDIPLDCVCDIAWLFTRNNWKSGDVACKYPNSLRDHYLSSLLPIDLCMNCEEILKNDNYTTSDQNNEGSGANITCVFVCSTDGPNNVISSEGIEIL